MDSFASLLWALESVSKSFPLSLSLSVSLSFFPSLPSLPSSRQSSSGDRGPTELAACCTHKASVQSPGTEKTSLCSALVSSRLFLYFPGNPDSLLPELVCVGFILVLASARMPSEDSFTLSQTRFSCPDGDGHHQRPPCIVGAVEELTGRRRKVPCCGRRHQGRLHPGNSGPSVACTCVG